MLTANSEIRVRYSGFIIFTAQIISLLTGLVFTLLLTRSMTTEEFGVWSFIFYLTGLFTLISGLFPFWATRFIARNKEGAIKTAVGANIIVGLVAAAIYLPLVTPILSGFNISMDYYLIYLLAALQILNTYLIAVFEGCLRAMKPQAVGFGLLIEEITKIALAVVLIVGLKQLFLGAIVSLIVSAAVQSLFYVWLLNGQLKLRIQWGYLREWLKGSTAFLYNAAGTQLVNLTTYVLVLVAGQVALGYYQAAVTFSTVIGFASSLAFALYPKMLAGEYKADLATSFKTVMMLALPLAVFAAVMATSLLTILRVDYAVATPILVLLAVDALLVLISQFYNQCLLGVERFDVEGKIPLRQLVKSKIFKVFTVPYIQAAIMLPADYLVLTSFSFADPVQAAASIVMVNIAVHTFTFIGLYLVMRKYVTIPVAWKSISKYILSSAVLGVVLFVLPQTSTLSTTFAKLLVGVGVYTGVLCTIDHDARLLVKEILREIRSNFR